MSIKRNKPAWFVLYLLVVMMIAAFIFENKDGLPAWANEVADIGIIIFVFAAMALWVRVNMSSLMDDELRNIKPGEYKITEYSPQTLSDDLEEELHTIVQAREASPK